jgi:3-oxoadipate enol-lactonase
MWHGLIDKVKKDGVESIVEQTAQRWFSDDFKARNPGVLDEVRAMIRRTTLDGYLGCVGAFLGMDVERDLGRIRVPTHYLSGAEDKVGGPPALMAGLAAKVPGARHTSVPGAAHIANIQNPAGFNKLVVDFLKEHS